MKLKLLAFAIFIFAIFTVLFTLTNNANANDKITQIEKINSSLAKKSYIIDSYFVSVKSDEINTYEKLKTFLDTNPNIKKVTNFIYKDVKYTFITDSEYACSNDNECYYPSDVEYIK